jgi:TonB family protein
MKLLMTIFLCGLSVCSAFAQEATQPPTQAPSSTTPPQPKPIRIRIGGATAASMLISHPQPIYPQEAKDKKIQGTVRLHAVLSREGAVQQLDIVSGEPILAKAAMDAVHDWKYRPTLLNGEPVEVDTVIDVIFQLKGKKPKS